MRGFTVKAEDLDIKMKKFKITKDDLQTIMEEIDTVHPWYTKSLDVVRSEDLIIGLKLKPNLITGILKHLLLKFGRWYVNNLVLNF